MEGPTGGNRLPITGIRKGLPKMIAQNAKLEDKKKDMKVIAERPARRNRRECL
jgi:hypothetical protein